MFHIKYYWILYIYCTSAGIFSLFLFIHKQCEDVKNWVFYDGDEIFLREYDYIVVGGGSGGSIVAKRLAQDPSSKVLLLEAGENPSILHEIPVTAPMLQGSHTDWAYRTLPQDNACLALQGRMSRWPMGKVVGGTSQLNYMIYLRGHPRDFDHWPLGWSWQEVLPYFRRSEAQLGIYKHDVESHGADGPIYVSDVEMLTEFGARLLEGGASLGYEVNRDLNSASQPSQPPGGIMRTQVTGRWGRRWSAQKALPPLASNLNLVTSATVEKVLLREGFEAYGVAVRRKGSLTEVRARKAVVLSAGAVGTPKILMLSGIGPKKHLQSLGIGVEVDLPVGENLQDHLTTGLDLIFFNSSLPISWQSILRAPIDTYQLLRHGNGILSHPGTDLVGLFHSDGGPQPDIQIMALPAGLSTDAGVVLAPAMGISQQAWKDYFSLFVGRQMATLLPVLLHPASRGWIRLQSSDPSQPPLINPKYLSHPQDVATLTRGLRLVQRLVEATEGATLNRAPFPGCFHLQFDTDPYWECYLRQLTLTSYHPAGTASIGPVLAPDLSVLKTRGLFVADASAIPSLTSANINSAILMVAERAADFILSYSASIRHTSQLLNFFLPSHFTPI